MHMCQCWKEFYMHVAYFETDGGSDSKRNRNFKLSRFKITAVKYQTISGGHVLFLDTSINPDKHGAECSWIEICIEPKISCYACCILGQGT